LIESFSRGIHFNKRERLANKTQVVINDEWVESILRKSGVLGQNESLIQRVLSSSQDPVVKAGLSAQTREAVNDGCFGVPVMLVGEDKELYFGSDRFEQLACIHGIPWYGPDPSRPTCKL
jgi:glutathione S-transferase kappa 1